jgi:SET and MYND domain-containing protein
MLTLLRASRFAAARRLVARFATAVPPTWLEQCSGLPVIAGQVEGAGRGLFALTDLKAGVTLSTFAPITAHPPHDRDDVCHACLRSLPASHVKHAATGKLLCSAACAQDAERRYLSAHASVRLAGFERSCAERDVLHPMLAARLALSVVQGAVHPAALDALCFARGAVEAPPPDWVEEYKQLAAAFSEGGLTAELQWFTLPWWIGVMARIHLNAFRVDVLCVHLFTTSLIVVVSR